MKSATAGYHQLVCMLKISMRKSSPRKDSGKERFHIGKTLASDTGSSAPLHIKSADAAILPDHYWYPAQLPSSVRQ